LTLFGLRNKGDVVETSEGMARTLISSGFAKLYTAPEKTETVKKTKKHTRG
jgi:hypothetical protein